MTPLASERPAYDTTYDAIVIGAGPAGLTAATYLGRFHRKALVLDGGASRASWIPESHNTPGFPHGVGGEALLARLRDQADRYGAQRRPGRARSLVRGADGFVLAFETEAPGEDADAPVIARAPFVLLATGVVDRLPAMEGVEDAIRAARVRLCPICDAYEATGQRIAVLGDGEHGAREAAFLTTYSADVTLLDLRADAPREGEGVFARMPVALADITVGPDAVTVAAAGQTPRTFDCLYLALGFDSQQTLARQAGAVLDADGRLTVSAHQQTSVEGLYAAGDVVRGLNQIAVATAEAAIAATDIHNQLRALTA
jgi:thioredoxin reductase (NADPH)